MCVRQSRLTLTLTLWLTELRHLLNSPCPQPSLGGRSPQDEFRKCSTSLHQSSIRLTKTAQNGSPSLRYLFCFFLFFLAKPALFFPLRLQILLRSQHEHTAVLREVSIILAHFHLVPWFPVTAYKSFFLFNNSEGIIKLD